ncbi:ribonuclease P protein component [alpha proteobacterium U9-1i]|nr:ribonuclease P protein component [alpha proteobacterium U9-1i]
MFVRDGAKARRGAVLVEARRRADDGPAGLGFTASKKVGNAVARNRAKRRLREAARALLPEHGLPGVDYVLVARQSAVEAPWGALLDDVGNALIRLRAELMGAPASGAKRVRSRAAESD